MSYLLVSNEPVVEIDGYFDGSTNLQLRHDSDNLVDNDDALQAEDSGTSIRLKLLDVVDGATTWVINASHESASGPISWSRGSGFAYYDFSEYMANFIELTATATANGNEKEKIIDIKTKPDGSLPDHGN
ncbi:MAG: hypothetical protein KC457_23485 [Myxococcales bacterium]|nr:hypothetical protein [Myxococcales bacterium]